MSSFQTLLGALLVLYVVESAIWIPPRSAGFRAAFLFGPRLKRIASPRPKGIGGIAFIPPVLVRGEVFVTSPFPFAISPDGIAIRVSDDSFANSGPFIPFREISSIDSEQRKLIFNERIQISLASHYEAAVFANLITEILQTPESKRHEAVRRSIAARMDDAAADSSLATFEEKTEILAALSLTLFFILFLASPILVWRWSLALVWIPILAAICLNMMLVAFFFRRSSKALATARDRGSSTDLLTLALSPVSALHVTKPLALSVSAGFDPLAIAAARSSKEDFCALASAVIRDLSCETDADRTAAPESRVCSRWFRDQYLGEIRNLARKLEIAEPDLNPPPLRESAAALCYCPRCLVQYAKDSGECSDCVGVALVHFGAIPN